MHLPSTKRIISLLLVTILLTAVLIPSASASITARINTSSAKAYRSASKNSESIKAAKNLQVSITDFYGSWAKISYKGITAYMPISYLTPTQKVKAYINEATTVYNVDGDKIGTASKGTMVYALGTIDGKYCVMNSSGSVGFIKAGTLSENKPEVEISNVKEVSDMHAVSNGSRIDVAISMAYSLLGTPYASSAEAPYSFNCSSFVKYCMGKAGYSMNRTAATQATDNRYEMITDLSDLKRGDILFFDTSEEGSIDHSVIYLGDNRFIEASRNAGRVQTNTLSSWYKKHFMWARRPA